MSPTPTSACFVPRKKGVWGLGCLETVAYCGASGCLPTCLEPGRDPSSELSLAQTNAGRQKIPIFLPTCVPAQALQKLSSSRQLCLIHPLAAGVRVYLGKEPLGSRLASVVDARHPVAPPVWTAGLGPGDGWSQVGREESDLWGQGASRSIWAGQVRGNQYFR